MVLSVSVLMSLSLNAGAKTYPNNFIAKKGVTEHEVELMNNGYELVVEESYVDSESGFFIVERTYVEKTSEDTAVQQDYKTFKKNVEKTKAVYRDPNLNYGDLMFMMYVGGTFESKSIDDIRVSNAYRDIKIENLFIGTYYFEKKFASESNCGANFLFGHKYAYVEYIITVTTPNGNFDQRLWLDVNVLGEETTKS